jgi:uncharacterized protein (TIGR03083 family)
LNDRVIALQRERLDLLRFCRHLDESQWTAPSMATGWRVQDVVAHMGSGCRSIFTLASVKIMRSSDIERTNDSFVDVRRRWTPSRTLREYERWSRALTAAAAAICRTPAAAVSMPLAELGRFPVGLVLTGAMTFDHHTHLRHDIAPALDLPPPPTDTARMAIVLEWMFAVLSNQLRSARPSWLTRSVAVTLHGPAGGRWVMGTEGLISSGSETIASEIAGNATEFVEWGTKRVDWRNRDVTIDGDKDYGCRFLDWMNIV